ncbi:hypothetical protein F5Y12DRAFT_303405 [Xylaria sp. FL1777]|nr:hypothetical protein F5Y12DRAFT_303405 [Xylaria sp. FL1777]
MTYGTFSSCHATGYYTTHDYYYSDEGLPSWVSYHQGRAEKTRLNKRKKKEGTGTGERDFTHTQSLLRTHTLTLTQLTYTHKRTQPHTTPPREPHDAYHHILVTIHPHPFLILLHSVDSCPSPSLHQDSCIVVSRPIENGPPFRKLLLLLLLLLLFCYCSATITATITTAAAFTTLPRPVENRRRLPWRSSLVDLPLCVTYSPP